MVDIYWFSYNEAGLSNNGCLNIREAGNLVAAQAKNLHAAASQSSAESVEAL